MVEKIKKKGRKRRGGRRGEEKGRGKIFELIFINIFVSRGSIRFKIAIFEWTIYLDAKMINILVLYFD
ncbi:hypothetical protein L1Z12_17975 [Acinetobacter baumannii]|nr:hypothetical protein [Acinetobacter baumannii]